MLGLTDDRWHMVRGQMKDRRRCYLPPHPFLGTTSHPRQPVVPGDTDTPSLTISSTQAHQCPAFYNQ